MHSYLKAVGFSDIFGKKELDSILNNVINEYDEKIVAAGRAGHFFTELVKKYGDDFGIVVCGEYDENNEFQMEYYFPYFFGTGITLQEEVIIENGDEEAMESLTIEDMDMYAMISKRVMDEDIYSIVDTYFMPYGMECDLYSVMGEILEREKTFNTMTKEAVYKMRIGCNDMEFDICINEQDLMGEPQVGRRFKGVVWLQGYVDFQY